MVARLDTSEVEDISGSFEVVDNSGGFELVERPEDSEVVDSSGAEVVERPGSNELVANVLPSVDRGSLLRFSTEAASTSLGPAMAAQAEIKK